MSEIKEIRWTTGFPNLGKDAREIHSYISGFDNNPEMIDDARSEDSPIHEFFEWDDTVAAEEHRHYQCNLLRRGVKVVRKINGQENVAPAFITVKHRDTTKDQPTTFKPIEVILADPEGRDYLLEEAIRELIRFRRKFATLDSLANFFKELDAVISMGGKE